MCTVQAALVIQSDYGIFIVEQDYQLESLISPTFTALCHTPFVIYTAVAVA